MWYTYSSFIKEGVEWETVMLNETGHVTEIVPLRIKASLVAQTVKNLPAMQETQVQSQDWKDPLEMEKATCSTPLFLPGKSHRRRSLEGYHPWGHKELDTTEQLTHSELNQNVNQT